MENRFVGTDPRELVVLSREETDWIRSNMNKPKLTPLEQHRNYVAFLKKRVESENYKAAVSAEAYQKTKDEYDKAKFKLKMLEPK